MDVARGGNYDAWDLEVRGGALGRVRICLAVEDHKECAQMVRYRMWPKTGNGTIVLAALTAALAALAALDAAWVAAGILSFLAAVLGVLVLGACGSATASALRALRRLET